MYHRNLFEKCTPVKRPVDCRMREWLRYNEDLMTPRTVPVLSYDYIPQNL